VGDWIRLTSAADGFELDAYHAPAEDARRGGLVVLQEIFGVNSNIRRICDGFAAEGYEVIAPALFDRQQPNFDIGYQDARGIAKGRSFADKADWSLVVGDVQAAIDALAGPVFLVGYCFGGSAAWMAASRATGLAAVSAFYGRLIPQFVDEQPRCPIILHFGKMDASIPLDGVETVGEAHPDVPIWLYDAGHGFCCDERADFQPDACRLARLRTSQLFLRNSGVRGEMGG
jgi:carboxymethylenebutenolidase